MKLVASCVGTGPLHKENGTITKDHHLDYYYFFNLASNQLLDGRNLDTGGWPNGTMFPNTHQNCNWINLLTLGHWSSLIKGPTPVLLKIDELCLKSGTAQEN